MSHSVVDMREQPDLLGGSQEVGVVLKPHGRSSCFRVCPAVPVGGRVRMAPIFEAGANSETVVKKLRSRRLEPH